MKLDLSNITANPKTSSLGAGLLIAGLSNLVWGWYSKTLTAQDVKLSIAGIVGGLAALASGDASQSVTKAQAQATFVRQPDAPAPAVAPNPAPVVPNPNKLPVITPKP
jgi:hypothetical protein